MIQDFYYKALGATILVANKVRHDFQGYRTPRSFSIDTDNYRRAIEYDIQIVDNWLTHLSRYLNQPCNESLVKDKNILELGPGADLGIGLYLLYLGAGKYNAVDVHNLADKTPMRFYDTFFDHLKEISPKSNLNDLRNQLELTYKGNSDRLNYIYSKDFNLLKVERKTIDIVLSNAAFEHFDDMERTVLQIGEIVKPGAVLAVEIDLMTHTRCVRDLDPLNIYRYGNFFYNTCKFRGSPNRLRPIEYVEIFKKNGWGNITVTPLMTISQEKLTKVNLHKKFRQKKYQMDYLTVFLTATKK